MHVEFRAAQPFGDGARLLQGRAGPLQRHAGAEQEGIRAAQDKAVERAKR